MPRIVAGRLPRRYIVAAMLCAGFINAYAMRTNLSVAVDTMQKRYSWSNEVEGNVLSAFFWVGCMCSDSQADYDLINLNRDTWLARSLAATWPHEWVVTPFLASESWPRR